MSDWRTLLAGLSALALLAAPACSKSAQPKGEEPSPSGEAVAPADDAPKAVAPGVKPRYVKCDPARPDMPCTPDTPPLDITGDAPKTAPAPDNVKPDYVKCDPARPEMPCTPDTPMPLPADPER